MVAMLAHLGAETIASCVGAEHYHLLTRFLDADVRGRIGRAKKNASHILRAHGLPGTVWAKRCGVHPIQDRQHQVNVFQYILDHAQDGAWTWDYRKPVPPLRGGSDLPKSSARSSAKADG
jgi:REP element-mobilizing transposase RayT